MQYGVLDHFQTGVAIPVSALRSQSSCGIGEYSDLALLAQWAVKTSMDLIQILPINDTGECASPYSALSAFALNPVYLSINKILGSESFATVLNEFAMANTGKVVEYQKVYQFKQSILQQIFALNSKKRNLISSVDAWIHQNSWIVPYALYSYFKAEFDQKAWWDWSDEYKFTSPSLIQSWAKKYKTQVRFYAWVQMQCEFQMKDLADTLNQLNVRLKGDIPILINEDSADAWGYPELFDMKSRAGAPPDMFCYSGQNWGFPCYNWETLKQQNYKWWRERLQRAALFYHAFRIDHVLGFFRIWQVPAEHRTGMLGRFVPAIPLLKKDLLAQGFTETDLSQFSEPTFHYDELKSRLSSTLCLEDYFEPQGDFWVFKSVYHGERSLDSLNLSEDDKGILINLMWNRILVTVDGESEHYYPYWYYYNSLTFNRLDSHKQSLIRSIMGQNAQAQEPFWEKNGEELLRMMSTETNMLVCAEDLGVVPECVAPVLQRLNILSLKIERWARDYQKEGSPFVNPQEYTRLSVNSPSCHDTSTLRGWWEENWDKENYLPLLPLEGVDVSPTLSTELARLLLIRNLNANSLLCLFPLQDWLSLHYDLREQQPEDERINIPGTLDAKNWCWRMKDSLEFLIQYDIFNNQVKDLVECRKNRPL